MAPSNLDRDWITTELDDNGHNSMMERVDRVVEPPFVRRRVQVTMTVIALIIVASVAIRCLPTVLRSPGDAAILAGESRSAHDQAPPLIQIDVNRAGWREFALLPGVGPILAERIVSNRDRLGSFRAFEDLGRVYGIGPKTLEEIRRFCVIDPRISAVASDVEAPQNDPRLASTGDRPDSER